MYLNLQIPFLDMRYFLKEYSDIFFNPSFFDDSLKMPYYRRFGELQYRKNAVSFPLSEKRYVESKKAVKFDQEFQRHYLLNSSERMYVDKQVIHFDIGLKTMQRQKMTYHDFMGFYKNLLTAKLFKGETKSVDFLHMPLLIARKYEWATTYNQYQDSALGKLIFSGHPIVFVEYKEGEITHFPDTLEKIYFNNDVCLQFTILFVGKIPTYVWFLKKEKKAEQTIARQARISLSKIHHEQICMEKFLNWLQLHKIEELNVPEVTEYADKLLNIIRKEKRKAQWSEIYEKAISTYSTLNRDAWCQSEELLFRCKKQLETVKVCLRKNTEFSLPSYRLTGGVSKNA